MKKQKETKNKTEGKMKEKIYNNKEQAFNAAFGRHYITSQKKMVDMREIERKLAKNNSKREEKIVKIAF